MWLNWSKSCGANGPTHLNLVVLILNMIWHSYLRKWLLFGKLKKSVNIKKAIFFIILCNVCIISINEFGHSDYFELLLPACRQGLTSTLIVMPASKTRWFGSVLTVVVVYFIAQSILEGKKFGSLDFFFTEEQAWRQASLH